MAWTGPIETIGWANATGALDMTFTGFSATIPVGTLVFIANCQNSGSATTTCVDNSTQAGAANVWTVRAAVNGTTHHGRIMWCVLTRSILTTDTITVHNTAPGSRQSGMLLTFTTPLGSPVDVAVASGTLTTSPCAVGPTATLAGTGELAMACHYWKGGAVASGVADATSGYTLVTPTSSGGTTTNEEACVSYKPTAGTAAESNTKTFTSITNCVAEIITFKPAATAADLVPLPPQKGSMGWDSPQRYQAPLSRMSGVFIDNAPPSIIAPVLSRAVANYKAPVSQVVPAYTPNPVVAPSFAGIAQSRPVPFYRGPGSYVMSVGADTADYLDYVQPALSRPSRWYSAPPSQSISAYFAPATQFGTDFASVAQSRPVPWYAAPRSQTTPVFFLPGTTDFAAVITSRIVPLYNPPLSHISPVYFALVIVPDSAVLVTQNQNPVFYRGAASLSVPVFDPSTATFRDWAPPATQGRVVLPYAAPRSYASPVFFAAPPPGNLVVQSILRPGYYSAPLSRVVPAINALIPAPSYVFVAQSRGTLARIASLSQIFMPPAGIAIITEVPNMGGGGEWVIWEKPYFPGNNPASWPKFPKPYFRKPSRTERRGY